MFATLILLLVNVVVYLCTCIWPKRGTPYTEQPISEEHLIGLATWRQMQRQSKNVDWKKEGF